MKISATDLLARLRGIARCARFENPALAREIDRLCEDVLGIRRETPGTATPTVTVIKGRRVLVQRPRPPFAL